MKRTVIVLLVLFGFSLPVFSAKTLVYCSEGSPEGFVPSIYTAGTTFDTTEPIFNQLIEFKRGETTIEPALAEEWEISKDGLQYTFFLRKKVKFQKTKNFTPTRNFNADDVIFTFERQLHPEHPYHKVSAGTYEYFNSMGMNTLIQSIEKIDDHTVRFNLTRPEAPFLADLAMSFASIVSAEYADQQAKKNDKDAFDQNPVGTGPFQLVNYRKDAMIRYKVNPDYWGKKPPIDNLVFSITTDASVRYQKIKSGECQIMPYPNPADVRAMKKDKNINLLEQEGLNVGYLAYNTKKKPFDDVRVRKALNMAINKKAIIDVVFQGAGKVAKNPIPPTMWSYNNAVKDDAYNIEEAKKLLKAAGIKNLKTNIWAMPVQRPYNPNARRMAELIQADWKKIGVNAEIITYEWGEYLKRSKDGEHDTVLLGWTGDNGDPDNFLSVLLGCDAVGAGNRAQWCYKPFDDLIKKAKITTDVKERAELYKKAQVVFKEQAPWATIAHSVVYMPISKRVKGYKISPFGTHLFYGVSIK